MDIESPEKETVQERGKMARWTSKYKKYSYQYNKYKKEFDRRVKQLKLFEDENK